MTGEPLAYPLDWPLGRPRTAAPDRMPGRFSSTRQNGVGDKSPRPIAVYDAYDRLIREIEMLGASLTVLSTNLELRRDGIPRVSRSPLPDPGAAVYFNLAGKPREPLALCCDRFTDVAQNIAALASHIDATRRIERYGVATAEQMFTGFAALPPPDGWQTMLGNPATLEAAEAVYRRAMRQAHPDTGGSHAAAAALNAAIAQARRELADGR